MSSGRASWAFLQFVRGLLEFLLGLQRRECFCEGGTWRAQALRVGPSEAEGNCFLEQTVYISCQCRAAGVLCTGGVCGFFEDLKTQLCKVTGFGLFLFFPFSASSWQGLSLSTWEHVHSLPGRVTISPIWSDGTDGFAIPHSSQ